MDIIGGSYVPTSDDAINALTELTTDNSAVIECPSLDGVEGYQLSAGEAGRIAYTFRDSAGQPINIEGLTTPTLIAPAASDCAKPVSAAVSVPNPANGEVYIEIPPTVRNRPGIYLVQTGLSASAGDPSTGIRSFLLSVEASLWSRKNEAKTSRPPAITIERIRTQMRDVANAPNDLIDGYEFSTKEIIHSLLRPIEYYNDTPPFTDRFTADNFPFPYQWLEGTVANLLKISATWYLRQGKRIQYSGGVVDDDKGKYQDYMNLAQSQWANYENFVSRTKLARVRGSGIHATGGYSPIRHSRWFP